MLPRLDTVRMLADGLDFGHEDRTALIAAARPTAHGVPPAASPEGFASSLPQPLTSLIGRAQEVTKLAELLGQSVVRLLTITGPGGVGKSRLALEVAAELGDLFPDGVHFIELAPISEPDLVASVVAQHLDVREAPGRTLTDKVVTHLRSHHALLVLDNFEHVLPAARVVTAILSACPHVTILATSRAPLHLRGEREWDLSPLRLPGTMDTQTAKDIAGTDAVRLFVERATAVLPDFSLTESNAATVAEICHRVDGLPLALELAAARMKVLSPDALLSRSDEHRLQVLTLGAQDLPSRQQTMRKTVAWSYDLLDSAERALFRRLSVFAGGWTLAAAEAVTNLHGDLDVLDGLTALVNGSLVRHRQGANRERRFEMLETVREYGLEQLASSGEGLITREAHAAWLLDLVRRAGSGLLVEDHAAWLAQLDDELANLRAALAQTLERGDLETTLQLAATPWLYWFESGRTNEGRSWLDRALAIEENVPLPVRAMGRSAAGSLAGTQGDYGHAEALLEAALADWKVLHEEQGIARTLHTLAVVALERNDNQRAAYLLEQALVRYGTPRTSADASWVALAVTHQACAFSGLGEHQRAIAHGEMAVTMQQEADSHIGVALGVTFLADFALERGDYTGARAGYFEGLTMMWNLGDRWHLLYTLTGFAIVMAERDPPERAARVLGAHMEGARSLWQPTIAAPPGRLRCRRGEGTRNAWGEGLLRILGSRYVAQPSRSCG